MINNDNSNRPASVLIAKVAAKYADEFGVSPEVALRKTVAYLAQEKADVLAESIREFAA